VRYLSTEWRDAVRRALTADTALKAATADVSLTIEHVVTGGPDGDVTWHVRLDGGTAELVDGPVGGVGGPDVRFTTTYETAAAVASGRLAAQRAFAEGRLRVGGDLRALTRWQRTFAALDDVLAGVRADTAFDPVP
jgi:hypothetical protein